MTPGAARPPALEEGHPRESGSRGRLAGTKPRRPPRGQPPELGAEPGGEAQPAVAPSLRPPSRGTDGRTPPPRAASPSAEAIPAAALLLCDERVSKRLAAESRGLTHRTRPHYFCGKLGAASALGCADMCTHQRRPPGRPAAPHSLAPVPVPHSPQPRRARRPAPGAGRPKGTFIRKGGAHLGGRRRPSRQRVPTSVQPRPQAPAEPSRPGVRRGERRSRGKTRRSGRGRAARLRVRRGGGGCARRGAIQAAAAAAPSSADARPARPALPLRAQLGRDPPPSPRGCPRLRCPVPGRALTPSRSAAASFGARRGRARAQAAGGARGGGDLRRQQPGARSAGREPHNVEPPAPREPRAASRSFSPRRRRPPARP